MTQITGDYFASFSVFLAPCALCLTRNEAINHNHVCTLTSQGNVGRAKPDDGEDHKDDKKACVSQCHSPSETMRRNNPPVHIHLTSVHSSI